MDAMDVTWTTDMIDFRGKSFVEVRQCLVSVHIPDFGRKEFEIGIDNPWSKGPLILPNSGGDVSLHFNAAGIANFV